MPDVKNQLKLLIALFLIFPLVINTLELSAHQEEEPTGMDEKVVVEERINKAKESEEMEVNQNKDVKRNFFQRLFGKPATKPPQNNDCWSYSDGVLHIQLDRAPELSKPGGAIRLEGEELPSKILIIHGDDGEYHAFKNACTHGKRCLDPVPGGGTVQCCSVGKSTFDYNGKVLRGSAKENIDVYPVQVDNGNLEVILKQAQ